LSVQRELLESATGPVFELHAANVSPEYLDQLLIQPLPHLKKLDIITPGPFPNVGLYITTGPPAFLYPSLVDFRFEMCAPGTAGRLGENILEFLRNCPQLEVAFFRYGGLIGELGFKESNTSTVWVPLPRLRSFTRESPSGVISRIGLFDRLSIPPTSDVTFTVTDEDCACIDASWSRGFPTPRDSSHHISCVKTIDITASAEGEGCGMVLVRAVFTNSEHKISYNRRVGSKFHANSAKVVGNVLDYVESIKMHCSVKVLRFECCLGRPTAGSDLDSGVVGPLQRPKSPQDTVTLVAWDKTRLLEIGMGVIGGGGRVLR